MSEYIVLWPDDTWCYMDELCEMSHMSDDYQLIPCDAPQAIKVIGEVA